ncbi:MAG: arsenic transporter [Betaproteobacteria bacterium]|nr:arsenic transporter [Betaproteobacteria bacterium]
MIISAITATCGIAVLATAGVVIRPFRWPEAGWAVAGACLLVLLGLLPWRDALSGIRKGTDVYLFLTGMMLIAEMARQEGLFDWIAALAVKHAKGSPQRLFALIYGVGVVVTALMSNDATAVVLTPAVYAAARAAKAEPLPYLLICAFIANAASFVLPISNPANLVLYGSYMPQLGTWLGQFGLASLASIAATYVMLRLTQRCALAAETLTAHVPQPKLSRGGVLTAYGIGAIAVVLLACSALDVQLGLPTFVCGAVTSVLVMVFNRSSPLPVIRQVSWGVLPLVAGLFVLVEGFDRVGAIAFLSALLHAAVAHSMAAAAWGSATVLAMACNLMNNLPVGLIAGSVMASEPLPPQVTGAALIAVDLGPNLSVTGSLATILWLIALRREGEAISAWRFLRLGFLVMPPALILAVGAMMLSV